MSKAVGLDKLLYTPVEAAHALAVSRSTIYVLMASGDILSVHIGASRRIPAEALRRYVKRLSTGTAVSDGGRPPDKPAAAVEVKPAIVEQDDSGPPGFRMLANSRPEASEGSNPEHATDEASKRPSAAHREPLQSQTRCSGPVGIDEVDPHFARLTQICVIWRNSGRTRLSYDGAMSVLERPDDAPHLRSFTVDDPRLWDARPQLSFEELKLEGLTDEEWDAFYAALDEE